MVQNTELKEPSFEVIIGNNIAKSTCTKIIVMAEGCLSGQST